jgi:hypothetical protein
MNEQRGGIPPINRQTLWVKRLPDTVIETQVIYVLLEAHTDIDVLQTLYSMWTYDGTWHLMTGENVIVITVTQFQYETLVTNNLLITGQQYLISDLTFTYNIGGTVIPATYIEPLLVTALNNNTLLPIAYPINHPNDYVEVDWSKPEITFRHDLLLNNHIGYDYRNKLNRRYRFNVSNIFEPNVSFDDWMLPSIDALSAMKTNLYDQTLGNLIDGVYLSSTETDATLCKVLTMNTGVVSDILKTDNTSILRPIRSFTILELVPSYSLGDVGPAGGYIFSIIDNLNDSFTYYETAPTSISSNVFDDVHLLIGTTLSTIESSLNNTLAIINQEGFTTGAAKDCINYVVNTKQYAQGDIVIDGNDNIYIAVKDNLSIVLTDGNWFEFPFKNGTYSATSNNNMFVVHGIPYYISANILDFVDGLTFRNTVNDVTTGSNFFNNVFFNILESSTFGDLNSYITSTDSNSYLHFGNNNSRIDINNCDNLTIGDDNNNLILNMIKSSIIGNNTYSIYITNGSTIINILTINACNSITISNYSNNIIITKTLQYSIIESHINNFISTVDTIDLHIKPYINLVNLTVEALNLLPLRFHKTIENMFIEGGVKPMLYYFDADSSLPILVEIQ